MLADRTSSQNWHTQTLTVLALLLLILPATIVAQSDDNATGSTTVDPWFFSSPVDTWSTEFDFSGVDGYILAIAHSGDDVYLAGEFTGVPGLTGSHQIIHWDGTSWNDMNAVFNLPINTMTVADDGALYVGGSFTTIQVPGKIVLARRVAKWDGTDWNELDTGVTGTVQTLEYENGVLYAGGSFKDANGIDAADIVAKWDGTSWSEVGIGLVGTAFDVHVDGTEIVVGGSFSQIGGTQDADNLVRWDGSQWTPMGLGLSGWVNSIEKSGGDLVVAGRFTNVGGDENLDSVIRWDGASWQLLGSTPWGAGPAEGLHVGPNGIYVFGDFENAAGLDDADGIAYFDGTAWSAPVAGITGLVQTVVENNGKLWFGGTFFDVGGNPDIDYLGTWDGATLTTPLPPRGNGLVGSVSALAFFKDNFYVAGSFYDAGGASDADFLARWDGSQWNGMGAVTNPASGFYKTDDFLYAFGNYRNINEDSDLGYITKWDGTQWSAVPDNLGRAGISAITEYNGTLVAGGVFQNVGGNPDADFLVQWDGSAWQPVGAAPNALVRALAVHDGMLCAGGQFVDLAGIDEADHIACWDGTTWHALGSGFENEVLALAEYDGKLVAGGTFRNVNNNDDADYIVIWEMGAWKPLDRGTSGVVRAIDVFNGELYVGGSFQHASSVSGTVNMARWTGRGWESLGGGVNSWVFAIAANETSVFVGGNFTASVSGVPSKGVAVYDYDPLRVDTENTEVPESSSLRVVSIWPNPMNTTASIELKSGETQQVQAEVFNILGQRVENVFEGLVQADVSRELTLDASSWGSGTYLLRLTGKTETVSRLIQVVQ